MSETGWDSSLLLRAVGGLDMDETIKWLFGIFSSVATIAFGYFHVRLNRSEDRNTIEIGKAVERQEEENGRLWASLTRHSDEMKAFKENVLTNFPTKKDIHDMETRLMAAIERVRK